MSKRQLENVLSTKFEKKKKRMLMQTLHTDQLHYGVTNNTNTSIKTRTKILDRGGE